MHICPSCSGEMKPREGSFLGKVNWAVCDDCGYREEFQDDAEIEIELSDIPPQMDIEEFKEMWQRGVEYLNTPIIQKEKFDVSASNMGLADPVLDEDGNLTHWKMRGRKEDE